MFHQESRPAHLHANLRWQKAPTVNHLSAGESHAAAAKNSKNLIIPLLSTYVYKSSNLG